MDWPRLSYYFELGISSQPMRHSTTELPAHKKMLLSGFEPESQPYSSELSAATRGLYD